MTPIRLTLSHLQLLAATATAVLAAPFADAMDDVPAQVAQQQAQPELTTAPPVVPGESVVTSETVSAVTAPASQVSQSRQGQEQDEYYDLLLLFADTIDQIDRNYVHQVSRRELVQAAIEGALRKLDPYSSYISPEEMAAFRMDVDSEFGGVGLRIGLSRGKMRVITPLVGTPAYEAGIRHGDTILAINGISAEGLNLQQAVQLLKGAPGTDVALKWTRQSDEQAVESTLTRQIIQVSTVRADRRLADDTWDFLYDPDARLGYIHITSFGRDTAAEVRAALLRLKDADARGLVLDLRFNAGGLLRAAIDVADLFLDEGTIVGTVGRNIRPQTWSAKQEGTDATIPLVVLVNQVSASASEIVAAALQDHGRATIVGQQTFGKASVQNVVELEAGKSALKLTTGSYQRPSGRAIHRFPGATEWGVVPDVQVLLGHGESQRLEAQRRKADIIESSDAASAQPPPARQPDRQLARALAELKERIASK